MKKKLFLLIVLGVTLLGVKESNCSVAYAVQSPPSSNVPGMLMAAAGSSFVTASYLWLQHREANSHVIEKVNRFWRHISENVSKVRTDEFSRLLPVFREFDIFVLDLHKQMHYRYTSWSSPWNWTGSMKQAYLRSCLLMIMFKYLDVMAGWYNGIADSVIVQLAETVVEGPGAVTNLIDELKQDIETVEWMAREVQCVFSTTLQQHLTVIRDMALASNAYRQERAVHV